MLKKIASIVFCTIYDKNTQKQELVYKTRAKATRTSEAKVGTLFRTQKLPVVKVPREQIGIYGKTKMLIYKHTFHL